MKLIVIVNNITNTFETAVSSRDLSAEELLHLHELVDHGGTRTLHYTDCSDRPMPFDDIYAVLTEHMKRNEC